FQEFHEIEQNRIRINLVHRFSVQNYKDVRCLKDQRLLPYTIIFLRSYSYNTERRIYQSIHLFDTDRTVLVCISSLPDVFRLAPASLIQTSIYTVIIHRIGQYNHQFVWTSTHLIAVLIYFLLFFIDKVSVVRRLEFLGRVNKSKTRIDVIFLLKLYVRRVVRIINTLSTYSVEEDCVAINIVMVESVNLKIHPLHLYRRTFIDSSIQRFNDNFNQLHDIIQPPTRGTSVLEPSQNFLSSNSSGTHHAEDERSLSARVTGCIRRRPMSETSKSVHQARLRIFSTNILIPLSHHAFCVLIHAFNPGVTRVVIHAIIISLGSRFQQLK
ncbi:hypothetical protein V1477_015034, partial [Vespula maculifrons]